MLFSECDMLRQSILIERTFKIPLAFNYKLEFKIYSITHVLIYIECNAW